MYFYLYKITNLVNGKIYIGCHQTKNLDDGYMGSGKVIKRAIKKYGKRKFNKEILQLFDTKDDMFKSESIIVNEDFIRRLDTYNLRPGGKGGFGKKAQDIGQKKANLKMRDPVLKAARKLKAMEGYDKWWAEFSDDEKIQFNTKRVAASRKNPNSGFAGCSHTNESKEKMKNSHKGKHSGKLNSQYGTCWIHSLTLMINKRIQKSELESYIQEGWIKGRKMNF